jgi:hypothetical protein
MTYSKNPNVVQVSEYSRHRVLAAVLGRGPAADLVLLHTALGRAASRARTETLTADAYF